MVRSKRVFFEALIVSILIFVAGLLFGFFIESKNVDKINEYYSSSEIFLMDVLAMGNLGNNNGELNCDIFLSSMVNFADKVYEEAIFLEDVESSRKISSGLERAFLRYDLMRTLLWINTENSLEECNGNLVVYLYERESENLVQSATQNVWSKVLNELKEKRGNDFILIPIAVDSNLSSLKLMLGKYNINQFPVLIINNNVSLVELKTAEEIEQNFN